jgi:7-cyano-7-deazaguanine synthase
VSRVCVLLSGGLDSAAAVALALERGDEAHPLYVRCGFVWERAELKWVARQLKALKSPRLKPLTVMDARDLCRWPGHWSLGGKGAPDAASAWDEVYLPGRNFLLFACAASYCRRTGVRRVAIGSLLGNPFADATPSFRRRAARLASDSYGIPLRFEAPFARWKKSRVARRWPALSKLAFSCISPRGLEPCGRCTKCAERRLEAA